MKLGTDTGSMTNYLASRTAMPKPQVGMGATLLMWSDRIAATIIAVSASGRMITVQHDKAKRTDARGYYTENQDYEYSPDPSGVIETARLTKRGWKIMGDGAGVLIGHRDHYVDPSF